METEPEKRDGAREREIGRGRRVIRGEKQKRHQGQGQGGARKAGALD